ncbi:hypothetical protein EK904_012291 [Melospiza melodia maxima]|nr:hypothetical protein EK904_012291 [Melospiza melodia maxima]
MLVVTSFPAMIPATLYSFMIILTGGLLDQECGGIHSGFMAIVLLDYKTRLVMNSGSKCIYSMLWFWQPGFKILYICQLKKSICIREETGSDVVNMHKEWDHNGNEFHSFGTYKQSNFIRIIWYCNKFNWYRHLGYGVTHIEMAGERPAHLSATIASASLHTSFEHTPAAWKKHNYLGKCSPGALGTLKEREVLEPHFIVHAAVIMPGLPMLTDDGFLAHTEISPSHLRPSSLATPHSPLVCTCRVISCDISEEPLSCAATLWRSLGLRYLSSQLQKSLHAVTGVTRETAIVFKEADSGLPPRLLSKEREDGKGLLNMKKLPGKPPDWKRGTVWILISSPEKQADSEESVQGQNRPFLTVDISAVSMHILTQGLSALPVSIAGTVAVSALADYFVLQLTSALLLEPVAYRLKVLIYMNLSSVVTFNSVFSCMSIYIQVVSAREREEKHGKSEKPLDVQSAVWYMM